MTTIAVFRSTLAMLFSVGIGKSDAELRALRIFEDCNADDLDVAEMMLEVEDALDVDMGDFSPRGGTVGDLVDAVDAVIASGRRENS